MKRLAWFTGFALVASPFAAMAQEAAVPEALAGLRFQREEAKQWYVAFGTEYDGKPLPTFRAMRSDSHPLKLEDPIESVTTPGQIFFSKGPMKGRFKFIRFDTKPVRNPKTGRMERLQVAEYEDLKPNKKGFKYEAIAGTYGVHTFEFQHDRTAVFTFKPKDKGVSETAEFKVEEFTNFAVPSDTPGTEFKLKEVSAEKVVVEYKDQAGAVRQATIAKHVKAPAEVLESLSYVREDSVQWYVSFGFESDGQWAPKMIGTHSNKKGIENRTLAALMLKPGDVFFGEEPMKERFKFNGFVKREVMSPRTKVIEEVSVALFEDLKPNKKGRKYESQQGLPAPEFASHAYYDRTAVLGIKVAGKDEPVEFKIEELTNFALPPDGPNKDYLMKEITPEKVVVEYKDQAGAVQRVTIPKRAAKPAADK